MALLIAERRRDIHGGLTWSDPKDRQIENARQPCNL